VLQAGLPAAAQEPLPGAEGPLSNDTYLPVAEAAAAELARGDRLHSELVADRNAGAMPAEAWIGVLEAWRSALCASASGDAVPPRPLVAGEAEPGVAAWPDEDGSAERRVEGVEAAVAWRLGALPQAARAAWTARFAPLAAQALAAALGAGDARAARLAAVEREHPLTEGAARAALLQAELELERGRTAAARSWCERGLSHGPSPELRAALEARGALCAELGSDGPGGGKTDPAGHGAWRSARGLAALEARTIAQPPPPRPGLRETPLGGGVQPGLAFLSDELLALQLVDRIAWLESRSGRTVYELAWKKLVADAGLIVGEPHAGPVPTSSAPGWAMRPAADGRLVVCVHGRSVGGNSNALVCLETPAAPPPAELGAPGPRVRWIVHRDRTLDAEGRETPFPPELRGAIEPDGELQPGPLILGSEVLVQVRRGGRASGSGAGGPVQIESSLLALDLETGRPLWRRFLARGVELVRDTGRLSTGDALRAPGQALVAIGGLVFCGTHLGAGSLVDPLDGRLVWTLLSRRRDPQRPGWTGWTPEPAGRTLLWAPADSDQLYWLDARASLPGPSRAPFLHPPRAAGEAVALLGGDAAEALVLARAGMRRTLSSWAAESGGRRDALYLAPDETFAGAGALSPERALFASDRGVYLFDRTRELYLLDYEPLQGPAQGGGDVYARGDRVLVVGREGLWILAVES
jgi:hypothetical protein